MFPYIKIFNKQITSYNLLVLVGILVCGFLAVYLVKKHNEDDNEMIKLLLFSSLGVFIGGHVLYGITNIETIIKVIKNLSIITNFKTFIDVFIYIFGGSVFYGGLIGGILVGYIYLKKKKLNLNIYTDISAIIIPLFHFFGRIGCFLVGCCYGIESKLGITFKHSLVESANNINRFPIQLVEATYNLLIFILLYFLHTKNKLKGKLIYLYLIIYAIGRFIFEFFRGDSYRGFLFGLSTSQIISLIIIFSIIIIFIYRKYKNK